MSSDHDNYPEFTEVNKMLIQLKSTQIIKAATPEEIEVYDVITRYKIALIKTNYCNIQHSFLCKIKNDSALYLQAKLEHARVCCIEIVNKTPYHTAILMNIIENQPLIIRERERLIELITNNQSNNIINNEDRKTSIFYPRI